MRRKQPTEDDRQRIIKRSRILVFLMVPVLWVILIPATIGMVRGEKFQAVLLVFNLAVLLCVIWRPRGTVEMIRLWSVLIMIPGVLFWLVTFLPAIESTLTGVDSPRGASLVDRFNLLAVLKNLALVLGIEIFAKARGMADYLRTRGAKDSEIAPRSSLRRPALLTTSSLLVLAAVAAGSLWTAHRDRERRAGNLELRSSSTAWEPDLDSLTEVAKLPRGVSGLTFDGDDLLALPYMKSDVYLYRIDPDSGHLSTEPNSNSARGGGLAMAADWQSLWIGGKNIKRIDRTTGGTLRTIRPEHPGMTDSLDCAGVAFDGEHLWLAIHRLDYDSEESPQRLFKMDLTTRRVLADYPLPEGPRKDSTHGLTWDGAVLWHAKNGTLSALSPDDGSVQAQVTIPQLDRPSGLAWAKGSLWIVTSDGQLWRLDGR